MAGVPGGGGHLEHVLVEGAAGLVDRERGQALHLGLGGDHRDPDGRRSPSAVRAATCGGAHGVGVVGQHDDLGGAARPSIASRSMPVDGRRPGPPSTTTAPASSKSCAQARAGGDRDDPAAAARSARCARGRGDLLGEVGDPDPVRAPGGDAGLDGGADVVDVDVDVPQPLAADDDERVAERRRAPLRSAGIAVVVGVEEVHHLVRRARRRSGRRLGTGVGIGMWRVPSGAVHGDRPPAGEHGLGRVEDHAEPAAAGVDDAGVAQHRELLGRPGQRLAGGRGGRR